MWFRQLQLNKKIIICAIVLIVAFSIGIVWFVVSENQNSQKGENATKSEQQKEDSVDNGAVTDAEEQSDGAQREETESSLEKLQPDEVATEHNTDASGNWEDDEETKQDSASGTDKKDKLDDETINNNDDDEKEKDILKDNITWGDIY